MSTTGCSGAFTGAEAIVFNPFGQIYGLEFGRWRKRVLYTKIIPLNSLGLMVKINIYADRFAPHFTRSSGDWNRGGGAPPIQSDSLFLAARTGRRRAGLRRIGKGNGSNRR